MKTIRIDSETLRFVFTTDWHLSDQPPGRRTAGYREEILAKVEFVRDLTQKLKAVGLFGGDLFHNKSPKSLGNTFSLTTRLIDTMYGFYLGRLFGTHGNHDLFADRVESIPSQPLGTVIAAGALEDLSATGSIIFESADATARVQVDAYPYTSDDMAALDRVLNAAPREAGVTHRIVLMHQYGDPGDAPTMFGHPTIGFNRMAECDYDFALWGHDHSRTETVTLGRCTHIRLGSLARAAYAEDEVDRPVAAAVLSFRGTKVGYKEVEVPVKPLQIAFTAAAKPVEQVRASDDVVEFFREMDTQVDSIDSEDPTVIARQLATYAPTEGAEPVLDRRLFDSFMEVCGF